MSQLIAHTRLDFGGTTTFAPSDANSALRWSLPKLLFANSAPNDSPVAGNLWRLPMPL